MEKGYDVKKCNNDVVYPYTSFWNVYPLTYCPLTSIFCYTLFMSKFSMVQSVTEINKLAQTHFHIFDRHPK